MEYRVTGLRNSKPMPGRGRAYFETVSGVVTRASPAFAWAQSKNISKVVEWCYSKALRLYVRDCDKHPWRQVV